MVKSLTLTGLVVLRYWCSRAARVAAERVVMAVRAEVIAAARKLADSEDLYEMDACGFVFADCPHGLKCAHGILLACAEAKLAREAA